MIKYDSKRYGSGTGVYVHYDEIDVCPKCHKALAPKQLFGIVYESLNSMEFAVMEFCVGCKSAVMSKYQLEKITKPDDYGHRRFSHYKAVEHITSVPIDFKEKSFNEEISSISIQFVEIYNQAYRAEGMGLDQIAGIGYRKALEFLIKDYAISKTPDNVDEIKTMFLGKCIDDYIDNANIQELSKKSAWLGNDETHYVKKHTDRDINDLKKFIEATVYFISMEAIVADAKSIEKK